MTTCLLLEGGEGGLKDFGSDVGVNGDFHGGGLDEHLVVLVTGPAARVLLVLVGRAAAVVKDGDHGGAGGLVHGHVEGGGTRAEGGGADRREGSRRGDEGGESEDLCHGFKLLDLTRVLPLSAPPEK